MAAMTTPAARPPTAGVARPEPLEPAPAYPVHEAEARAVTDPGWAGYGDGLRSRQHALRRRAQATWRAMDGWEWPSETLPEQWEATLGQAVQDYRSGSFLIERLGAARYLDPALMATLLELRQRLLAGLGAPSAATHMAADMAVIAYYNAVRVQGWIGDLSDALEHEFFGLPAPTVKIKQDPSQRLARHQLDGLRVEDTFRRISEQMLPLLDRANRMMLRNLRAMRELSAAPAPNVSINQAAQVNVGTVQQNVTERPRG